ncbi:MAG TPA: ECF transporter S component [Thermaerobacter sp.]
MVRRMVRLALLASMAFLLMLWEIQLTPLLPFIPAYLKYDPGDLPVLMGGFAFGPAAGATVALVKDLLFLFSGKSTAGWIGVSANLLASLAYVVPAAWVYRKLGTRWALGLAMLVGTVSTSAVMAVANYVVFLPLWGVPAEQVGATVVTAITPFNLIKGLLTGVLALVAYPRVARVLDDPVFAAPAAEAWAGETAGEPRRP